MIKRNHNLAHIIGTCLLAVILSGCTKQREVEEMTIQETMNQSEEETQQTQSEDNKTQNGLEWYAKIAEDSCMSVGENGRLDAVLGKLSNGEPVTIAAIGGSVTEGAGASKTEECYVSRFVDGLKERYPNADITSVNAGVGGTPSALGVIRYERDVTQALGKEPDLVLVEFAVNDYEEPTDGRAYESMVRTILEKENKPAVILVFSVFKSKWNMQDVYKPIGELYGLPMVSVKDGIKAAYDSGKLNDDMYFSDEYHPTSFGHKIMADSLLYMIDQKQKNLTDKISELSEETVYGTDFTQMHFLSAQSDTDKCVAAGGFDMTDTELQHTPHRKDAVFADNWMHGAESGSEPFVAKLNCRNILLNYKTSNRDSFGKASVFVDGEFVVELSGYSEGGWNNSNIALLLDEQTTKEHVLEIIMSEGEEQKQFTIQCIGYCDGEGNQ